MFHIIWVLALVWSRVVLGAPVYLEKGWNPVLDQSSPKKYGVPLEKRQDLSSEESKFVDTMNASFKSAETMFDTYTGVLKAVDPDQHDPQINTIASNTDRMLSMAVTYCQTVEARFGKGKWEPVMKNALTPFISQASPVVQGLADKGKKISQATASQLSGDTDKVVKCAEKAGADASALKISLDNFNKRSK
ncbi:hypothetical protein TRICI_005032 [Trichomonascus ciferrii]|uniref:Uncharacterized protein n=1 Tax=Trichomonascus ciferrii TaxID=44093 RepID=A0A642V246_9ASCO|nr:hypothetical protein TRICI_005032 [Trichomonascus ciferrii]